MRWRSHVPQDRKVFLVDLRGAVPEYVGMLAQALGGRGHVVTVITSREARDRVCACVRTSNVRIIAPCDLRRSGGARNAWPYFLGLARLVLAALVVRPSVLHFEWMVRPGIESRIARPLARLIGAASVYTVHNVVPHETSELPPALERTYLAMDGLVVHTEKSRADLLARSPRLGTKPIVVSPHGNYAALSPTLETSRDVARAMLGLDPDRFIVGFVGSIRPYKGVLELVAGFEMIRRKVHGVQLVIAGRPDDATYAASVREAADRLPTGSVRCEFRHLVTDEFVAYVKALDLLILPYRAIDQSGVLLFAMTLGASMVLPDIPSFSETLDPTEATFVAPGDPEALAHAVLVLAGDADRRATIGVNAACAARARFGWDRIAELHGGLYRALTA